jgi:hypothetical protein
MGRELSSAVADSLRFGLSQTHIRRAQAQMPPEKAAVDKKPQLFFMPASFSAMLVMPERMK